MSPAFAALLSRRRLERGKSLSFVRAAPGGSLIPFRQDIRFARTTDDLRIAYAVSGRGYPLVRAATWMSNVEFDWRTSIHGPLFRELGAQNKLYRYGSRGYGLSEGGDAEISIDTLLADLEA